MAGIGFTLQNLLKNDSFISRIKAYSYSALISSGPWIYSLLSFAAVSFFVTADIEMNRLFQATIIYIFAFSQIITGAFQLIATRIIADYIYAAKFEMISVVYLNSLIYVLPVLFAVGFPLFGYSSPGVAYTAISTLLFVLMGAVWMQLIILTACRDFKTISNKFAGGFVISVAVSILLGSKFGFVFYFFGFTAGVLYIFYSLHVQILTEFGHAGSCLEMFDDASRFSKYFILTGVGLFFNLGVWADKIMFWFGGGGRNVCGLIYENSVYDRMNLVLVTLIIPVMALFTLKVETDFYVKFRNFYKSIVDKENLDSIRFNLKIMKKSILKGAFATLEIAAPLAVVMIIFSKQIMAALKMPEGFAVNWSVFTLGALAHCFFLLSLIMLMYFDFLKETFVSSGVFLALNVATNAAGIWLYGASAMGWGYFISVSIALLTSSYFLKTRLDNLLFYTFSRERVPGENVVKLKKEK